MCIRDRVYDMQILVDNHSDESWNSLMAVSLKGQPMQIVNASSDGKQMLYTIPIVKKNTEEYLSPMEFHYRKSENKLFAAGKSFFHAYDTETMKLCFASKELKKKEIVSAFDLANPSASNYESIKNAAILGGFDKRISVLDLASDKIVHTMKAHMNGVTCVKSHPTDSFYCFSGARQDNVVYQWDLRAMDTYVRYFEHKGSTNQRMKFTVSEDGELLVLGDTEGSVLIFSVKDGEIQTSFKDHEDTVNCADFLRNQILLTVSGSRSYSFKSSTTAAQRTASKNSNSGRMVIEDDDDSDENSSTTSSDADEYEDSGAKAAGSIIAKKQSLISIRDLSFRQDQVNNNFAGCVSVLSLFDLHFLLSLYDLE
eukprot:TRINITY_DN11158_c0_g1_i2.p1 TRINITY_DN11158_c0_g1~~TRINITY_DN11158_c0_g1_i2.p1  ORF type:complete len:368 (-),score=35.41 TRINITY_DN11158_c0_g1_i2:118-1221(-)